MKKNKTHSVHLLFNFPDYSKIKKISNSEYMPVATLIKRWVHDVIDKIYIDDVLGKIDTDKKKTEEQTRLSL